MCGGLKLKCMGDGWKSFSLTSGLTGTLAHLPWTFMATDKT